MRITLTLDPWRGEGGGSRSFARVLAETLPGLGVEVSVDPAAPADAVLVFAQHATPWGLLRHRRRGARILHRLDERLEAHETPERRRKHRRIRRLNALADVTIFQSEFVRRNVGPLCSAPRARVVHNGVDPRVFHPDGPSLPLAGAPAALHVSWSVGASKRLDRVGELLEAGPPGLHVHCVGRHAASGAAWLGHPRVTLHGPCDREKVAALMRSAAFLFFPSEDDPCPNTPIEAMACGLPCLYHPSGGTVEIVGDAGVALGASPLAADVARVMDGRAALRERALGRAPRFFAVPVASRYVDAVREALDAPPARPGLVRTLWTLLGS